MSGRSIIVLTVLLPIALATLAGCGYFVYRILTMYVDREIGQQLQVTSEWTEITPQSPMRVNRKFQAVTLVIDGARVSTKSDGVFLPDGTKINPEVRILDTSGKWYETRGGSYGVSNYDSETETMEARTASFGLDEDDYAPTTQFRTVLIRSDKPFVCAKIIWRNYDLK